MKLAVEKLPHWKNTHGVQGWSATIEASVTSQQDSRASTSSWTVVPVGFSEESRKICMFIVYGSAPLNCGIAANRNVGAIRVVHCAFLASTSWVGLNWKSTSWIFSPRAMIRPIGGSWMASVALTRLAPAWADELLIGSASRVDKAVEDDLEGLGRDQVAVRVE